MSRKLVERVSRVVERRAGRRGFLRKSAMAATAVAVAPVAYAIRPTTAEAAIVTCRGHRCDSRSLCCDGYSEFCCKLTGKNLCPPGTLVAGWWKSDGSGFCDLDGPRPRYYLDCNYLCDSECRCSSSGFCAKGCTPAKCQCSEGCDTRKSECLRFRYGQCNQGTCIGELVCRIVTCVPPWQWDTNCKSSPVLTDNGTRRHDRPCLHEGFTDIPPKAFYAEAVEWMAAEGIATGFTDDLFGPNELVTRAQLAAFLWRYQRTLEREPEVTAADSNTGDESDDVPGDDESEDGPGDDAVEDAPDEDESVAAAAAEKFDDVSADAYYAPAVGWMVAEGITYGRTPTQFDPDSNVRRAAAVVFLHRLAGSPPATDSIEFTDVEAHAWYRPALAWAVTTEIVWWTNVESFGGGLPLNRSDVALLLHRFHNRRSCLPPVDPLEPPCDIPIPR